MTPPSLLSFQPFRWQWLPLAVANLHVASPSSFPSPVLPIPGIKSSLLERPRVTLFSWPEYNWYTWVRTRFVGGRGESNFLTFVVSYRYQSGDVKGRITLDIFLDGKGHIIILSSSMQTCLGTAGRHIRANRSWNQTNLGSFPVSPLILVRVELWQKKKKRSSNVCSLTLQKCNAAIVQLKKNSGVSRRWLDLDPELRGELKRYKYGAPLYSGNIQS